MLDADRLAGAHPVQRGGVQVPGGRLVVAGAADPPIGVRHGGSQRRGQAGPVADLGRPAAHGRGRGGQRVQVQVVVAQPGQHRAAPAVVNRLAGPGPQPGRHLGDPPAADPDAGAGPAAEFGVAQQQPGRTGLGRAARRGAPGHPATARPDATLACRQSSPRPSWPGPPAPTAGRGREEGLRVAGLPRVSITDLAGGAAGGPAAGRGRPHHRPAPRGATRRGRQPGGGGTGRGPRRRERAPADRRRVRAAARPAGAAAGRARLHAGPRRRHPPDGRRRGPGRGGREPERRRHHQPAGIGDPGPGAADHRGAAGPRARSRSSRWPTPRCWAARSSAAGYRARRTGHAPAGHRSGARPPRRPRSCGSR